MKFQTAISGVLFLGLALSGGAPANDAETDIAAIRQAAEQWMTFYRAGDLERLMSLYAPDAIVALHGKPALRGIGQIRDFFAPGMGKSRISFEIDIEEIQIHGDTAHLLSKYCLSAQPLSGGETYRDAGRSLIIYKRNRNNEWKLYLDIDQATPDATFEGANRCRYSP